MIRYFRLVAACLVLAVSAFAAARPFPQEKSDLKADPSVRFGSLPNGLRYAIKANAEPKGRAALRLLVDAGSFMEKDSQQGLAHFLEHMSFNGSEHYAPGTLIEFFQRMGMDFGGDTNAYTSFDHTVYQIELPDTKEATLAEGLRVFSDYAGGLLLLAPEIEKERGVILSEKRARDSVEYRTFLAEYAFAFPQALFAKRFPIGTEEVISKAGREEFTDFYNTWYRPELTTVVLVGDFDVAAVEKLVQATFAGAKERAPARETPSFGKVDGKRQLEAGYHHEAEAAATEITLRRVVPYPKITYTSALLLEREPLELALSMFNRRMAELAKKEGAPFSNAYMSDSEGYGIMRETSISIVCKPGQWEAALAVADQELRRALEHGFQASEYKVAAANKRNSLEQAVKTASTRRSPQVADQLVNALQSEAVFTSDADDLALIGPALDRIDAKACTEALRKVWQGGVQTIFVSGNCVIPGDAPAAILAAYRKTQGQAVAAPEKQAELRWDYTNFGVAAKVASRSKVEDLGIEQVRFANGLRLNIKKTDFEAGQISVRVRVGSGLAVQPATQPGLAPFTSSFFMMGGLGKLSSDELRRVLAGRNVSPGFQVGDDSLIFGGRTTPADLELQLELLAAAISDPGYRSESERQFAKVLEQFYNRLEHTVQGPLNTTVASVLASGDPRFGLPAREVIASRTLAEMKAWLAPQFASGPLEVNVVGDLDVEKVIELVASTLGALPRSESSALPESVLSVKAPEVPVERVIEVETKIDKALVHIAWPTRTDSRDYRRCRRLGMLADVFNDRLRVKIREELGESYSPDVSQDASTGFHDYGFIRAYLMVDPAKAEKLRDIVLAISESLRKDGLSEDELSRAKLPTLTRMRESVRTNGYWLGGVLDQSQDRAEKLEAARNRMADVEGITVAELKALAAEYLGADRAFRFIIKPTAK